MGGSIKKTKVSNSHTKTHLPATHIICFSLTIQPLSPNTSKLREDFPTWRLLRPLDIIRIVRVTRSWRRIRLRRRQDTGNLDHFMLLRNQIRRERTQRRRQHYSPPGPNPRSVDITSGTTTIRSRRDFSILLSRRVVIDRHPGNIFITLLHLPLPTTTIAPLARYQTPRATLWRIRSRCRSGRRSRRRRRCRPLRRGRWRRWRRWRRSSSCSSSRNTRCDTIFRRKCPPHLNIHPPPMIPIIQMHLEIRGRQPRAGLVQHALVRTVETFNPGNPVVHEISRRLFARLQGY